MHKNSLFILYIQHIHQKRNGQNQQFDHFNVASNQNVNNNCQTLFSSIKQANQVLQSKHFQPQISIQILPSSDKFLWNQESQQIFAKIVTAIGLKGIKPKQITKWMPKRFKLNCQQIGSHLQKYKLRVQRDFQLYSFDQFENWMVPKHLQDPVVEALAAKWLDQRYQGTSQAELMKLSE
ncbi:Conserved_hypothetical protein [Hexamita inflata]|uniref:HTH myb-type domain-containing protein n=1 Tax=Hexamita inflata TaxID=28002 RepID=A0ABP1H7R4_9EUKA